MTISLGMPSAPAPVLAPRRRSRKITVGKVEVGGDAPISVQSMCTTQTTDVNATLQQIAELTATGCDIVRVACPTQDDADALPQIARHSQIPVIAADTDLSSEDAHMLGMALTGMAQVSARYWLSRGAQIPHEEAAAIVGQLAWRGIGGFPKRDSATRAVSVEQPARS